MIQAKANLNLERSEVMPMYNKTHASGNARLEVINLFREVSKPPP
jgi:hypothetical protein